MKRWRLPFGPIMMELRFIWVQEEPENMGAWPFLKMRFGETVARPFAAEGNLASGVRESRNGFAQQPQKRAGTVDCMQRSHLRMSGLTTMPVELIVPSVGESITEVEIGDWLKNAGRNTSIEDEPVVVIETDKVTVELAAPAAGRSRSF